MTDFGEDDGRQVRGTQVQRLVTLSGALVSLALICGMGYWGYKLLVRDVHGVPVVQAMEGAFRIAPEDPGGTQAPYQGLAVNEVAAGGSAGGQVDQVTLAPPPVRLAAEDKPREVLVERRKAAEVVAAAEEIGAEPDEGIAGETLANAETGAEEPAKGLAELGTAGDETPGENAEVVTVDDQPEGALATDLAVAEALAGLMVEEGVADATSPRPSPRPAAMRMAAGRLAGERPITVSAEMPVPAEIDVASLDTGTSLVQLGAFVDADVARREWSRIIQQFGDHFAGKRRVVQQATSGGQTFYRLRAEGFDDLAEARRFCSALLAGKADCIPVEVQ